MALKHIDGAGNIQWHCPNARCGKHASKGEHHAAHISHEAIQFSPSGRVVSLPTCGCGEQVFLKVSFTEDEWAGLKDKNGQPTGSHDVALHHIEMARQLRQAGKG